VHWPYTLDFGECYLVAQWGAAMLLAAALFYWRADTQRKRIRHSPQSYN